MDTVGLAALTSPVVLFFVLGLFAAFVKSDLAIPEAIAKAMSIYLMAAIGLKGGIEVAESGLSATVLAVLAAGIGVGLLMPIYAFWLLRSFGRLDNVNAGAVAAHYGSISVVTFVTAVEIYTAQGNTPAGYMVAVMATMESPAILAGLLLANRGGEKARDDSVGHGSGGMLHEVFFNASVVLLLGAFAIGWISGPEGFASVEPMFGSLFKGVLCLFLLDMGLVAARRLMDSRAMTLRLVVIALALPLFNGIVGTVLGAFIGLDTGSTAAFGVLCASASYIAVPAAMRLALPQADAGIYLTMSLSVTFPFNVLVNIGLIGALAASLTASSGG